MKLVDVFKLDVRGMKSMEDYAGQLSKKGRWNYKASRQTAWGGYYCDLGGRQAPRRFKWLCVPLSPCAQNRARGPRGSKGSPFQSLLRVLLLTLMGRSLVAATSEPCCCCCRCRCC